MAFASGHKSHRTAVEIVFATTEIFVQVLTFLEIEEVVQVRSVCKDLVGSLEAY